MIFKHLRKFLEIDVEKTFADIEADINHDASRNPFGLERLTERLTPCIDNAPTNMAARQALYQQLLEGTVYLPVPVGQSRPKIMELATIKSPQGKRLIIAFETPNLESNLINAEHFSMFGLGMAKVSEMAIMQGVDGVLMVRPGGGMEMLNLFELRYLSENDMPPSLYAVPESDPQSEPPPEAEAQETTDVPAFHLVDTTLLAEPVARLRQMLMLHGSRIQLAYLFTLPNRLTEDKVPVPTLGICFTGNHTNWFEETLWPELLLMLHEEGMETAEWLALDQHPPLAQQLRQTAQPVFEAATASNS